MTIEERPHGVIDGPTYGHGEAGPYVVSTLRDLCTLAEGRCTLGDAGVLLRLLREAGRLRTESDQVIIDVADRAEMDAWVTRAVVAARRERSAIVEVLRRR